MSEDNVVYVTPETVEEIAEKGAKRVKAVLEDIEAERKLDTEDRLDEIRTQVGEIHARCESAAAEKAQREAEDLKRQVIAEAAKPGGLTEFLQVVTEMDQEEKRQSDEPLYVPNPEPQPKPRYDPRQLPPKKVVE